MSEEQTTEKAQYRPVRSYVVRAGRMTTAQKRGFDNYWPRYGLDRTQGMLDLSEVFGREAPVVLEIGFGMGHSLVAQAQAHPERDYLGIEVHPPGVGRLLHDAGELELTNIRVYQEDALETLKSCIPDASLDGIQLFFPDPWPKKRHHKRRIVQPPFVQLIRSKLKMNGLFHMATDWEPYAEHMVEVMAVAEGFSNQAQDGVYVPRPDSRPVTKFERRGERLGHGVWDLMYRRTA